MVLAGSLFSGLSNGSGMCCRDDMGRQYTFILVVEGFRLSLPGYVLCLCVDFFLLGVVYHGALLEMRTYGFERWMGGVG